MAEILVNGIVEWKADVRAWLDQLSTLFEARFGYTLYEDSNLLEMLTEYSGQAAKC